jgi:enoyl-CoA hydratase/carnithine racemase
MEHILLGEPLSAETAEAYGVVNRVVADGDVVTAAVELAERVCANGPLAVRASKRIARTAVTEGPEAAWALNDRLAPEVSGSEDAAEGMAAAREKRPATWSAR